MPYLTILKKEIKRNALSFVIWTAYLVHLYVSPHDGSDL